MTDDEMAEILISSVGKPSMTELGAMHIAVFIYAWLNEL